MKRTLSITFFVLLAVLLLVGFKMTSAENHYITISEKEKFSSKSNAFDLIMEVIAHDRCMNCHPSDNLPKQGDKNLPHQFGIARGNDNHGFSALKCATCHQKENNDYSGVPGAPHWGLAPASMGWEGLSKIEIASAMLDKSKNGNRSHEEIIEHLTEDKLVLWAFDPGVDQSGKMRTKPPVSKEAYIRAVKEWFASGAIIPHN